MSLFYKRNEAACVATAERLNASRSISGKGMDTWLAAWKPDLLLIKQEVEYGGSKHGGFDGAGAGKKEVFENWLKLPKLIKDMFCRMARKVDNKEEYIRELKIAGFSHNYLRVSLLIMDSPEGYVCRLPRTKDYEVPLAIPQILKRLIPILKLILAAKALILKNVHLLEFGPETTRDEDEEPCLLVHEPISNSQILLPTALNPPTTQSKKRKVNDAEED